MTAKVRPTNKQTVAIGQAVVLGIDEGFDIPVDAQGKLAIVREWVGTMEYIVYVPAVHSDDNTNICIAEYHIERTVTRLDDPALHDLAYWQ